jgi:hypothetical protein
MRRRTTARDCRLGPCLKHSSGVAPTHGSARRDAKARVAPSDPTHDQGVEQWPSARPGRQRRVAASGRSPRRGDPTVQSTIGRTPHSLDGDRRSPPGGLRMGLWVEADDARPTGRRWRRLTPSTEIDDAPPHGGSGAGDGRDRPREPPDGRAASLPRRRSTTPTHDDGPGTHGRAPRGRGRRGRPTPSTESDASDARDPRAPTRGQPLPPSPGKSTPHSLDGDRRPPPDADARGHETYQPSHASPRRRRPPSTVADVAVTKDGRRAARPPGQQEGEERERGRKDTARRGRRLTPSTEIDAATPHRPCHEPDIPPTPPRDVRGREVGGRGRRLTPSTEIDDAHDRLLFHTLPPRGGGGGDSVDENDASLPRRRSTQHADTSSNPPRLCPLPPPGGTPLLDAGTDPLPPRRRGRRTLDGGRRRERRRDPRTGLPGHGRPTPPAPRAARDASLPRRRSTPSTARVGGAGRTESGRHGTRRPTRGGLGGRLTPSTEIDGPLPPDTGTLGEHH